MASRLTEAFLEEMNRYLTGEMNELERKRFEEMVANDAELKKEFTLEKELRDTLGDSDDYTILAGSKNNEELAALKTKLRSDEYQQLSNTIKNVGAEYLEEQPIKKPIKSFYIYTAVAAAIILFFTIYTIQKNAYIDSFYVNNVNWSELPSFVEKGNQENAFAKGEIAFKKGNYNEAIAIFSQVKTSNKRKFIYSQLYIGASYDLLGENEKAIAVFHKVAAPGDTYEGSMGHWYETLMHLKMKNREKAIASLKDHLKNPDDFKYDEAVELLDYLE